MPANALYGLVRFAAASTNEEWLDDLVGGAATRIEETIRVGHSLAALCTQTDIRVGS